MYGRQRRVGDKRRGGDQHTDAACWRSLQDSSTSSQQLWTRSLIRLKSPSEQLAMTTARRRPDSESPGRKVCSTRPLRGRRSATDVKRGSSRKRVLMVELIEHSDGSLEGAKVRELGRGGRRRQQHDECKVSTETVYLSGG